MKKNNNRTLELADLQKMLLDICANLNRPIRKTQLIKLVIEIFECNTQKQVDFAILDLIEQDKLHYTKHFICTPEFATTWDGTVTAADEGIIKFLLSLKEEIKIDVYFSPYAPEPLMPTIFFKYVLLKYPALLQREDTALAYMEQIDTLFPDIASNNFYMEFNDYPTNRWFTSFFNDKDCRIVIKKIDQHKNHLNIHLLLLPSTRRSYKLAHEQYEEFDQNIKSYFNNNIHLHIKTTLLTMITGTHPRRRKRGK